MLLPGLLNKARLLLERHQTTIRDEYQQSVTTDQFLSRHEQIDFEIKLEKTRSIKVCRNFTILDIVVTAAILSLYSFLEYRYYYHGGMMRTDITIQFLAPVLDVIIALILVNSACFLSKQLQKQTGKKQKVLLIILHIVNLCFLIVLLVFKAIIWTSYISASDEETKATLWLQYTIIRLLSDIFSIYVDLFLLWLLYKFMKPQ